MSQTVPDRQSQEQDNLIKDTSVNGNLTFAPVQIGTKIGTVIVESSLEKVTQRKLNKNSPYQGLKRFNFKDRDRFFGRDALIARLFEAVNRSNLSLVLGASGSGKSSVVRAGLIPELKKSLESQTFYDFIFTPNQDPFDSLYRCLLNEEKDYSFRKSEARIALEAQADTLTKVISTLKKDTERWLIFVDQFEELFTICDDPDKRKDFITGLVQVAKSGDQSVKIVLAMRSDFLEQISFHPDLGDIANQNNIHLVNEMYPDELRQAIEQPAAQHGVVFEAGLVQQIIEDVQGQKGYLPLLQYTLSLLWESECKPLGANSRSPIEDRVLNKISYGALEGVRGALQKRVNEIYNDICEKNKDGEAVTKQIFLKLVNIVDTDSNNRTASRRAYRSEFVGESVEKLLNRFIEENLLISSSEYSSSEELQVSGSKSLKQSATIEIAHEILLSSWDRLKRWLEEEKEAIILKNWLSSEMKRWQKIRSQNEAQANDELLKGSRLIQVVEFRERDAFHNIGGLSSEEKEFIDASVAWQERIETEKAAQRRREIRTAWGITLGSVVALLASIGLGLTAWHQSKQAELNLADALGFSSLYLLDQGKELDAFVKAIRAGKILQNQHAYNAGVMHALQVALDERSEQNRLQANDSVNSVSFSPDGKTLATGSSDWGIKLWNLETGEELQSLWGHNDYVSSVSFSPDGKTLASSSGDKTIKLWNLETGKETRTLQGHDELVNSVSFSPDGKTLASSSGDKTIKLWNLETGKETRTLQGHDELVNSVSFSPDGKTLASSSNDKTIKLWNTETGEETRTLQGHNNWVSAISFSPDGKTLASSSGDKTIKLWNTETGEEIRTLQGHNNWVSAISFSPNGKTLATGSADKTIKLWNTETGEETRMLQGHDDYVSSVSFSPDGKTLATSSGDTTIRLWNLATSAEIRTLQGHDDYVWSVSFSPDGKTLATGGTDWGIKLWNLETGKELQSLWGHDGPVWSVSFSPNGKTLASGSGDKTIKLWNLETGKEIRTLQGHHNWVWSVSFSPDGKTLASSSNDKTIKLWNTETGEEAHTLQGHSDWVSSVSFNPDGKTLASGSADKTIKLWNTETGEETRTLQGHDDWVRSISFSPDGKTLVSSSNDKTIKLWNLETGEEIRTLQGHDDSVRSVSFSPDGKTLASGSADKTIKLWNTETGEEIRTLQGHDDWVSSVSFSPDGKTLATGSTDRTAKLWNLRFWTLDLDPLIEQSCDWVRVYLNSRPEDDPDKHLCDGIGTQQ